MLPPVFPWYLLMGMITMTPLKMACRYTYQQCSDNLIDFTIVCTCMIVIAVSVYVIAVSVYVIVVSVYVIVVSVYVIVVSVTGFCYSPLLLTSSRWQ